jgi:hypothetical protein
MNGIKSITHITSRCPASTAHRNIQLGFSGASCDWSELMLCVGHPQPLLLHCCILPTKHMCCTCAWTDGATYTPAQTPRCSCAAASTAHSFKRHAFGGAANALSSRGCWLTKHKAHNIHTACSKPSSNAGVWLFARNPPSHCWSTTVVDVPQNLFSQNPQLTTPRKVC